MSFVMLAVVLATSPIRPVDPAQPGNQLRQRVACDGAGCFVSWTRAPAYDLWSRAVAPSGPGGSSSSLEGWAASRALLVGLATGAGLRLHYFDTKGTGGDHNLYLALSRDGGPPNALGLAVIDNPTGYPGGASCAESSAEFLCAYDMKKGMLTSINLRRLDLDGGFLNDAGLELQTGGNLTGNPHVVSVGETFIVSWQDRITTQQFDIYAAIVHAGGALGPQLFPVSALRDEEGDLAAAPADGGALLAWTVQSTPPRVRFSQVDLDAGTFQWPLEFVGAREPALSWHGDRWFVALTRELDGGSVVEARVVTAADAGDSALLFTSPGPSDTSSVAARVDEGQAVLVYSAYDADAGVGRLQFMFVGLRFVGEGCLEDGWCQSGRCEAGACLPPDPQPGAGAAVKRLRLGCDCSSAPTAELLGALTIALLVARRARHHRPSPPPSAEAGTSVSSP